MPALIIQYVLEELGNLSTNYRKRLASRNSALEPLSRDIRGRCITTEVAFKSK